MKKLAYLFTAALAVAALSACDNGEGEYLSYGNKDLAVVEANLLFGPEGGSNTITVESTNAVTAASEASWASVSVNGKSIVVTAPAYSSNETRYAKITIKAGNESTFVVAQQMGVMVKDFNPSDINATSKAETFDFTFVSNTTMTATADVDWITPSVIKATGTDEPDTLRISLLENPTIDVRTGVVSYAAGTYNGTINVTQAGAMVQNPNWTITYEGVTKVDGHSRDDFQVAVGSEDTGKYAFTYLPASQYSASGLEMADFVVTGVVPALGASPVMYSDTQHFYYPKLENDKYIAFAVGLDDNGLTTGYYQYLEFEINRDKTPYEKLLGSWTIERKGNGTSVTDTWTIYEDVEDESFLIEGIEGHAFSFFGGAYVAAQFDASTGELVLNEQIIATVQLNDDPVDVALYGYITVGGTNYYWGEGAEMIRIKANDDNTATMTASTADSRYGPFTGMVFYGLVDGTVTYWWCGGNYQQLPAALTKAAGTSSVKPKSVPIPMRLEDAVIVPASYTVSAK